MAREGKSWTVVSGESPIAKRELVDGAQAVVSENAANKLGLAPGDHIRFSTPKGDLELSVRAIIVNYTSEKGAVFIDRRRYIEHFGDESVDSMSLYLKDGADPKVVGDRVRAALGGGNSLFVTETNVLKRQLVTALTDAFSYSKSVELITLVIALLGVVGTMAAAILDRTREIGMLRAVGATRRQVVTSIVIESGFLGFCAVVGGICVGVQQCMLMLSTVIINDTGWNLSFSFPYEGIARIFALVVFTAALAGVGPALRAARLAPKEALSYE
jgi:putative ABC transport system permease protein